MNAHWLACVVVIPLLAIGCVAETEDDLVFDDDRAGPYPPPPADGTPEAYGMLRVANELSFEQLDDDVPLNRRSATSIVAYRAGDDELLGTADDQFIPSVAVLDSLYWLGPANLWRLVNYATLEGYVPAVLPPLSCEPELDDAIDQCLRFVEDAATPVQGGQGSFGWAPFADDLRSSCLEASDPTYPSAAYFSDAGVVGYLEPVLGYQGTLCDAAPEPVCALGSAGIAARSMPQCESLFDVDPLLADYATDPADVADWDAAIAALEANCGGECGYWVRVFDYQPGMAPTLLGDVMDQVLPNAPLAYQGPWLEREPSDIIPPMAAGAQALLVDVIADLGLTGAAYDVGTAAEEVPCPNCHIFHDGFVLMFRDDRTVIVLDRDTFWDS